MVLKKRTKNPPIFSHEFVIQNHADIVSCMAMIFVLGLLLQVTVPIASLFVVISHNVTLSDVVEEGVPVINHYTYGIRDVCATFFYFLICIIVHAVVQEYLLDKLNRKMHLSKVKHSKFNESGQLLVFYLVSVVWAGDLVFRENDFVTRLSKLWEDYPHSEMTFMYKFFFLVQLCYWLHCFPELYFQKTKKEEMFSRIQYAVLYFIFILAAYVLNFTRIALVLIALHYLVEIVFHASRLLYFSEKNDAANRGFALWNVLFVMVRLGSIILSVLTFWYGLSMGDVPSIDIETGNFNTNLIRVNCLAAVCLLQAWMMWTFINFHLRRRRELLALEAALKKKSGGGDAKSEKKSPKADTKETKTPGRRKSERATKKADVSDLPEVDQHSSKSLRSRKVK